MMVVSLDWTHGLLIEKQQAPILPKELYIPYQSTINRLRASDYSFGIPRPGEGGLFLFHKLYVIINQQVTESRGIDNYFIYKTLKIRSGGGLTLIINSGRRNVDF
jgi:hypothetical protein